MRVGDWFRVETVSHRAIRPSIERSQAVFVAECGFDDLHIPDSVAAEICSERFGGCLCRLDGYHLIIVFARLETPHSTMRAGVDEQFPACQYRVLGKIFRMIKDGIERDDE